MMKRLWLLTFAALNIFPAISHAEEVVAAAPVIESAPAAPIPEPEKPAPPQAPEPAPVENNKVESKPEAVQAPATQNHDRPDRLHDNNRDQHRDDHKLDQSKPDAAKPEASKQDWQKNKDWPKRNGSNQSDARHGTWQHRDDDHDRGNHHRPPHIIFRPAPPIVYHRVPPRIVYVYPQSYYPTTTYVYSDYPSDYVPTFQIGDYLPDDREWLLLPNYADYGLPAPRVGEQWVYSGRDVVLIETQTGEIVSAIVLAASID